MSFENFIQNFKKEINTNDIFDGSFNISNIKNYISSDPALEEELQYYSNKIESYKSTIYDRLEKSGKQHVTFSTLTSNVDISDNTAYENYENKKENNDTFYDNFQNDKGSGRAAFNDDFKTTFESKRNNNSLNFCTNMLGNFIGNFNLVIPQTLSSTFFYMNLIPVNKLKTLSGGSSERQTQTGTETEMHNKPKAYYQGTVNNVTVKILLEIITLNQSPYFYTTIFNNNTYYCPIFQVVNGLIVSSELFPEGSYLQFIYSSSNTLTNNNNNNNNNNNITSNQSPKWSWVRIYETEKRQSDSDYGNPSSNKKTYLYYVYTNDPSGPQTNYLYPSKVPDYCPDGIILPWTIYLYSNGNVYTLNANQGAQNVYQTLFFSVQSIKVGGITIGGIGSNKMYEKLGYYPSNI